MTVSEMINLINESSESETDAELDHSDDFQPEKKPEKYKNIPCNFLIFFSLDFQIKNSLQNLYMKK